MGRITVFSADACSHSVRLRSCLAQHGITEYEEINITKHPEKRVEMMSLTNSVSTPQVFFNTRFIGGVTEVMQEMERWVKESSRRGTPYQRFLTEIQSQPDPLDKRFDPPKPLYDNRSVRSLFTEGEIELPDGEFATLVEVTELLKDVLSFGENRKSSVIYKNSFSGEDATKKLQQHFSLTSEQAIAFGEDARSFGILQHVKKSTEPFSDKANSYYRLYCHQNTDVLNSYCALPRGKGFVVKDPIKLTRRLQSLIHKIEADCMNNEGKVNYNEAAEHTLFPEFEKTTCELQQVDLALMNNSFRIAFGINVYNIMIKYALIKFGVAKSGPGRTAFFHQVKFLIGEHTFSFHEWEHGIMRGNKKAPVGLQPPFNKRDPRRELVVSKPDGRIHFALNCGANSCPPIRFFTGENVHKELGIVTMGFCEDESNVCIRENNVFLNKIFLWYRSDFPGNSNRDLAKMIIGYMCAGLKKQALAKLVANTSGNIKISALPYDWNPNASEIKDFQVRELKVNCSRLKRRLSLA